MLGVAAHHRQPRALDLVLAFCLRLRGRQRRRDGHRPGPGDLAVRPPRRGAEIGQADQRRRVLPRTGPARLARLLARRERGRDVGDGPDGDTARGQVARGVEVLVPVQQPGLRGRAVPAGPPELLVVRVQRGRRIGVQHPAHVRLVDPHAERDRGHDDAGRAAEERGHRVVPLAPGQPGVVERHPLACFGERVVRRLRAGVRRRIDNPRACEPVRRADKLLPLVGDRARAVHRQVDVRPVEVADHHHGIAQAEPPHDLLPYRRRGRRGQRQPDRRADRLGLRAEPHVVGPEVVAPLADQVRLVHGEQPRPRPLER